MSNVVALKKPGIRSEAELKRFVRHHANATPNEMVQAISISIELATTADNAGHHHRLNAGRLLNELRQDIEAGGENWWKWQRGKFSRSRRDIEKLLKIGAADDPEGAAADERDRNRKSQARSRDAADVSGKQVTEIEHILELIEALDDQDREQLRVECKERWSW